MSRLLSTGKKNIFTVSTVFFAIIAGHEVLSIGITSNIVPPKWDPAVGSGGGFLPIILYLTDRSPRPTTVSKSTTSCSSIRVSETIVTNLIRGERCVICSYRTALSLNYSRHPAWSPNTIFICHQNTLDWRLNFCKCHKKISIDNYANIETI